jgi:ankyrin repeat protein
LLLHEKVDPSAKNNYCILVASKSGFYDIVCLLLCHPQVDPPLSAFLASCENGHTAIAKRLIEDSRVDPSDSTCLVLASENGHTDIVALLLSDPRIDPATQSNLPVITAKEKGYDNIVRLLMQHEKVRRQLYLQQMMEKSKENSECTIL